MGGDQLRLHLGRIMYDVKLGRPQVSIPFAV